MKNHVKETCNFIFKKLFCLIFKSFRLIEHMLPCCKIYNFTFCSFSACRNQHSQTFNYVTNIKKSPPLKEYIFLNLFCFILYY